MISELNSLKCVIYKITNLRNNKCYVGLSYNTFKARYPGREWYTSHSINRILKNSIKKNGPENFKVEIVEHSIDPDSLENREIHYIKHFNSLHPNGYNLTGGGCARRTVSEETRKKLSLALKGKPAWNKGKKSTATHIERSRLAKLGKPAWNKGLKTGRPSEEAILNSAKAHRKAVKQYDLEGNFIMEYPSVKSTEDYGFRPSQVSLCCKNKAKSHKNYKFILSK